MKKDGPEHSYVILIDNGRSKIYASNYAGSAGLYSLRRVPEWLSSGRSTGGHAYGWSIRAQSGGHHALAARIGKRQTAPHASSLCGMCKEVCPVDIDLPRMLLDLRHDLVEMVLTTGYGIGVLWVWKMVNKSPRLFELSGGRLQGEGGLRRRSCPPIRWLDDVSLVAFVCAQVFSPDVA